MIDFGGNSISPKCADLISQIISLNNLRILRLAEAGLDTKILSQICIGLAKSGIFEELDLSQNKIGTKDFWFVNFLDDFGLKSLILVLKHSKTLKYIDLRSNNFSDPVLQELDRTLRTNKIMAEKTIKIF